MWISVRQDNIFVEWNDDEVKHGKPSVMIGGLVVNTSEQDLKNLYDCLDFLFGTKNEPYLRQV